MRLTAQALITKKRTVPWSQVARLDIRDGTLYIDDAQGRTIEVLIVSDTPNFYVFHTLARQLRTQSQPTSS
ncbi:hypothetical protein JK358_08915 [Nocardia sp. 2]|uniref:KTSC domain-containing protein n=1 Tax=Nocardia acididurans TaxID=2802282 RepID=A0ABS1M1J4_9NOCA|nr:hypothetical protein [Nocardia acididurans]